eukprot:CAMPEP_0184122840 /NCGR_PEP_ID=MMETSP0974-20121125/23696_1 /TAXON_ID=483370 /ORGANISM="non described non described, Strain CCMP2097" /LENGTH=310 /DNA_ID=CAMNT_0026426093 /DNA_START=64 /DNA_END=994 /DNA_ORIENTATION=-
MSNEGSSKNEGNSKEAELAKRGVDAYVDRANELHHQGRHVEAFKQLERARKICEKSLGPAHASTIKVLFIITSMRDVDGSMRKPTDSNLHFTSFDATTETAACAGHFELARIVRRRTFVEEMGINEEAEFDEHDAASKHTIGFLGDAPVTYVPFDATTETAACAGHFELARIVRRRTFVEEMGINEEAEFDEHDAASKHTIGFLGDAPVTYARWRITGDVALVDRLCTLRGYRRRSVARSCLETVAQDISSCALRLSVSLRGLLLLIPQHQTVLQQKLAAANFVLLGSCETPRGLLVQMCLPASTTSSYR